LCDASDQLGLAISNGTEAGCLALSDEISQQDCLFTIQAQKKDTDRDGLTDGEEINIYKTNPLISDTDGDGFADGLEVDSGYDPLK
jgi:putative ubiquitin-RnfH superfamily antitoxin RatB of RatAB toxin-antitoxin module